MSLIAAFVALENVSRKKTSFPVASSASKVLNGKSIEVQNK